MIKEKLEEALPEVFLFHAYCGMLSLLRYSMSLPIDRAQARAS